MMRYGLLCLCFFLVTCGFLPKKPQAQNDTKAVESASIDPEQVLTKIQFASCADPSKPQPIWHTMLQSRPQLFLATGDNVYINKQGPPRFAEIYSQQAAIPEFKLFRQQVPILATWDDNDYGLADGGSDYVFKEQSKLEFLRFFPESAKLLTPAQDGVYHSAMLGPAEKSIHIIFLDTRYFRDSLEKNINPKDPLDIYKPTNDINKTLIGEKQWNWLEQELQKKSQVKILISSIQFLHENHGFEKWANFPHEKKRMLLLLRKYKPKNLIILSGDRHQSEVHRLQDKVYGSIYEFTSSGINRAASNLTNPELSNTRISPLFRSFGYGEINIDWNHNQIEVELKDERGLSIFKLAPLRVDGKAWE